jgi:hypothetical protein
MRQKINVSFKSVICVNIYMYESAVCLIIGLLYRRAMETQQMMEQLRARLLAGRTSANLGMIIAKMGAHQERQEANMNAWREGNKASLENTEAYLERKEPIPVEMANGATHPEEL